MHFPTKLSVYRGLGITLLIPALTLLHAADLPTISGEVTF
jgi:hypothetical protein